MSPEERLAAIVAALESVGLCCLVMGGHAVRFYGLQRYTNDFDFTLAPDGWDDLAERLVRTGLFPGAINTSSQVLSPIRVRIKRSEHGSTAVTTVAATQAVAPGWDKARPTRGRGRRKRSSRSAVVQAARKGATACVESWIARNVFNPLCAVLRLDRMADHSGNVSLTKNNANAVAATSTIASARENFLGVAAGMASVPRGKLGVFDVTYRF